jgi:hypothetical protein
MNKIKTIWFVLGIIAILPIAWAAISTTTQVSFNIGTVVAYTLTLPGEGAVDANSTGAPTTAIEFFSATGNDNNLNPDVVGGPTQSDGTPIFMFDNTGTVDLNISVSLDSNLPGCMSLKGATTYAGADIASAITSGETIVVEDFTPAASAQEWYMKADFVNCYVVDSTTRTLTSTGVQS